MKFSLIILTALTFAQFASAEKIDTREASKKIDALIAKQYAPNKIKPNPLTDDSTFVRRAYLDITGRIPTAAETRSFTSSTEPGKRAKLIDQLLDSDGHVSHQYNYWADILRISSRLNGQGPQNGAAYIRWVKDAIAKNTPYDEFVTSLITAQGMVDENGAAGFYLRDRGMPLDHLATTVQVFLGTQMVCAQCHDHPFDEWTQMDYYELAAFSSPMDVVRNPPTIKAAVTLINQKVNEKKQELNKLKNESRRNKKKGNFVRNDLNIRKLTTEARKSTRALNQISYNFRNSVIGETDKKLKLPHDYQYSDAKPGEVISPLTPFGDKITVKQGESRIGAYARWMTAESNPRFTKTIANRLWKRAMGIGLIEPVDNLREDTEASNPELMAYLEKLLIDLDYDMKAYLRTIYNTKTYQREAQSVDLLSKYHYPGPRLRRMSAEQVWDSLVTLIRPDADAAQSTYQTDTTRLDAWKRIAATPPKAILKRRIELTKFIDDSNQQMDEFRDQIDKAIAKKDPAQAKKIATRLIAFNQNNRSEYARLTYWDLGNTRARYFQTPLRNAPNNLYRQLRGAFPKADLPNPNKMQNMAGNSMMMGGGGKKTFKKAEQKALRQEMGKEAYAQYEREQKFKERFRNYTRASELSSPAPDGHFLRTFGQSDRQLIQNANDEASVPQTLALLNGTIFRTIANPHSVVTSEATAASDPTATINSIYQSMLSRDATEKEQSLLRPEFELSKNRTTAIQGIIWTVLNTQQFLFIE